MQKEQIKEGVKVIETKHPEYGTFIINFAFELDGIKSWNLRGVRGSKVMDNEKFYSIVK